MKASTAFSCLAALLAMLASKDSIAENPYVLLHVRGHTILAEVANTREKILKGLMARSSLPENQGMLFVFPVSAIHPFWMKNTVRPLSIAFLDEQGRVINIEKMSPMTETLHNPAAPAKLALEMKQGWFGAHGVRTGDRIACAEGGNLGCAPNFR